MRGIMAGSTNNNNININRYRSADEKKIIFCVIHDFFKKNITDLDPDIRLDVVVVFW